MIFMMKRACAQVIDFFLAILTLFAIFGLLLPRLSGVLTNDIFRSLLGLILFVTVYYLVQLPFMQNGQTVGKGFYHLKIISTDEFRQDVPVVVIIQREILCKLASCFFICLPMLMGRNGGHEEATHTAVIQEARKSLLRKVQPSK